MLPSEGVDLDGILEKIENGFIERALERARGNKTMAAELLRLNRTTFIERLRKKGMLQPTAPPAHADTRRRYVGGEYFIDGAALSQLEFDSADAGGSLGKPAPRREYKLRYPLA